MRGTPKWVLFLLVLLSSVLLPLALPNDILGGAVKALGLLPGENLYWGSAALGLVCIAPVFFAVSVAPSFGFASLLGVIFGAVSTVLANYWLMFFQGYSVWTMGGVIVGYMGYNALLFPFLRGLARTRTRYRPFLLAAGWAVYEYFKSVGFLAYPWGLVAYPVGDLLPLIQFVDVTGTWGLSFLIALVNALTAEAALPAEAALSGWKRGLFARQAIFCVFLAACALGYGYYRLARPIPYETKARFLLVQQNMDPWEEGSARDESILINGDLTLEGVRGSSPAPDLAVWSESSVSSILVESGNRFNPAKNGLIPIVQQAGIPVLFGGVVVRDFAKNEFMNSAVLVSSEGKVVDTYGKMHGVPFAETIPFFEFEPVQRFFRQVVGIWNPWVLGSRATVFSVPLRAGGSVSFGVPICFEDAFANLCRGFFIRGADLLVNITNDSWSKTWSAEIQHFSVARFRAVENRRVLVRSTNGGVSGVVGPWGEVRARLPFFTRTWRTVEFPVYREKSMTLYTRLGDWFPLVLMAVILAVLAAGAFGKKSGRPAGRP